MATQSRHVDLSKYDPEQVKFLEDDECILVDHSDNVVGFAPKKVCHLLANIDEGRGMLHRAFSLFLFNSAGQLLLQRRAEVKITYPGHYTNSCCSHPLHTPEETEMREALGVRRAAQRKVKHELGIDSSDLPLTNITYVTRILYRADNSPRDNCWGEHELDYILVAKHPDTSIRMAPNPNEVSAVRWVGRDDFPKFLEECRRTNIPITPWFTMIHESGNLGRIWDHLDCLDKVQDHTTIHKLE